MLTLKYQLSKKCKDGKSRNFCLFFIDGELALKLKVPYNENYEKGYDTKCHFSDITYDEKYIYMTKISDGKNEPKIRNVKYPRKKKNHNQLTK